jgi:hypothetical protein
MLKNFLAPLMLASTLAGAQVPMIERRPPVDVAALLGLDSARAAQVEAILATAHAKMRSAHREIGRPTDEATRSAMHAAMDAIHTQTDQQLAAVLSPDELDKLHEAMRASRPPGRAQPSASSS